MISGCAESTRSQPKRSEGLLADVWNACRPAAPRTCGACRQKAHQNFACRAPNTWMSHRLAICPRPESPALESWPSSVQCPDGKAHQPVQMQAVGARTEPPA